MYFAKYLGIRKGIVWSFSDSEEMAREKMMMFYERRVRKTNKLASFL